MDNIIEQNREWINTTFAKLECKLSRTAVRSRNIIPYTTENGIHVGVSRAYCYNPAAWWTNGFWGGLMWLMYNETGNDEFKKTAERTEHFMDEALMDYKGLHHDVGFMWHLTSGANYRITGNERSMNRNLFAAASLFSRYNIDGEYIRAWNQDKAKNWSIIDCLMNIPLLYWASEEIGDDRFAKVAKKHADMALKHHIREDGSVNHIVEHNPDKPEMVKAYAGQGYSETSCWSRGLAWAVYGMVLSYIHTNKKEYLEAAIKTLKNIDAKYCDYTDTEDSILQMSTERYPHDKTALNGVHIPIIYGDFFFVEAILIPIIRLPAERDTANLKV